MTRLIYYPGGPYGGDVLNQEFITGRWVSTGARKLLPLETPESLMTSPSEQPTTGQSGSGNSHARLSPSASDRWSVCTASIHLEHANKDKVLLMKVDKVRKLAPYLETFPDELHDYEVRGMKLAADLHNGKTYLGYLTAEQRRDIERTEGTRNTREGTRAHDFAEAILNGRRTLDSIPEEFQHHVGRYVAYCISRVPEGVSPLIEAKVPLWYSPDETGTFDFVPVISEERVEIIDLKYGEGKLYHSKGNTQLAIYCLSLIRHQEEEGLISFAPDTIVSMCIFQPRHSEAGDPKPWEITLKELEEFCAPIDAIATTIKSGEGLEFVVADEVCQFCDCRSFCSARVEAASASLDNPDAGYRGIDLLGLLPDDDEIPDLKKKEFQALPVAERLVARMEYATNGKSGILSDADGIALKRNAPAIRKFLDDNDEYYEARVLGGEQIDDFKICLGRPGNREWADEDAADTFLKGQGLKQEERYNFKLKSPTQAEEILADKLEKSTRTKNRFKELVSRSNPKKVVAFIEDKRPAVDAAINLLPEDEEDGL